MTPATIVAGTILAQVSLLAIMSIAGRLIRRDQTLVRWYKELPNYAGFGWTLLALTLVTLSTLVLSDGFAETWRPLFQSLSYSGIPWSLAVPVVFAADIVVLTVFVAQSGGSTRSPFQPLYFFLPTIALFLRESSGRVILYSVAVGLSFALLLFVPPLGEGAADDEARHRLAYGLVSLLCLLATCFIGIFTRSLS